MMLLVLVFGVSAGFAADAEDGIQATDESAETVSVTNTQNTTLTDSRSNELPENLGATNEESYGSSNNDVLAAGEGTFTELASEISKGGTITLQKNYKYDSSKDSNHIDGIVIDKSITINGNGKTIDGNSMARIFYINGTDVVLKNIKFINGKANRTTAYGGAIFWSGQNGELSNCEFYKNNALYRGGALYSTGNNLLINNTKFSENNLTSASGGANTAGAAYLSGSNNNILNSQFIKNYAYSTGALNIRGQYNTLDNCLFDQNHGAYYSSSMYVTGAHVTITNTNVTNGIFGITNAGVVSTTSTGAGLYIENAAYAIVDNCIFKDIYNHGSTSDGAAITMRSDYAVLSNSKFINNKGNMTVNGAGAVVWYSSYGTIENCEFTNNDAGRWGGLYVAGTGVTVKDSTFSNNNARTSGGAIYWNGVAGTIENCKIESSDASIGGGIYVNQNYLTISNTNFTNNKANSTNGGAAYIASSYNTIDGCNFNNNNANNTGGAIHMAGDSNSVENSKFTNNVAKSNSGAYYIASGKNAYTSNNQGLTSSNVNATNVTQLENRAFYISPTGKGTGKSINDLANWTYAYEHIAPGNTIYFVNGVYTGISATINKNLHLIGLGNNVNIDGENGNKRMFYIPLGVSVSFDKINFKNTIGTAATTTYTGLCMYILGNVNVTDCTFTNFSGYWGAAIATSNANVKLNVYNSKFKNCKAPASCGPAITINGDWATAYGEYWIVNCTFDDCYAGADAGALRIEEPNVYVVNCTFTNNTAKTKGGAISTYSDTVIDNCKFINNTAGTDGGAVSYCDLENRRVPGGQVINSEFSGNTASSNGGGIYLTGTETSITDSEFTNNDAKNGGGLYTTATNVVVNNVSFEGNNATNGGGVYINSNRNIEIIDSNFTNNNAGNGTVYLGNNAGIDLENIDFSGNTVETGSDITLVGTIASEIVYYSPTGKGMGLTEDDPANWTTAYKNVRTGGKIIFLQGTYSDLIKRLLFQFSEVIL